MASVDSAILDDRYDLLVELAERSAEMAKDELADIRTSFTGLDSKAGACSTVAAAVVGILGFVGKIEQSSGFCGSLGSVWGASLMVPAGFAVATIILSLIAVRVQELPSPHNINSLMQELGDLRYNIEQADFSHELAYNFTYSRLKLWKRAIENIEEKTVLKAKWVRRCQSSLAFSLVTLGAILMTAMASSAFS